MEYGESGSQQEINSQSENKNNNFVSLFGIFFCHDCQNMLVPSGANQNILEFQCKSCQKKQIDFTQRYDRECMIYSKQLQPGSRKSIADPDFVFDPTMPRIKVDCQQCGYGEAVYFLTSDQGERKIVVKLICANATDKLIKCEHIWQLDQKHPLYHEVALNR